MPRRAPQAKHRVALVTGASQGLGRVFARALAAQSCHVLLLARQEKALQQLYDEIVAAGGSATGVPLDVTDFPALNRLGAHIAKQWGRLDILLANAGLLGPLTPTSHLTHRQLERVIKVNCTANQHLIRVCESLLLAAPYGRAVFITSGAVRSCRPFFASYSASKAALEALVKCWAAEQKSTSLRINLLDPGPRRTAMRRRAQPGEDPQSVPTPHALLPHLWPLLAKDCRAHGALIQGRAPAAA